MRKYTCWSKNNAPYTASREVMGYWVTHGVKVLVVDLSHVKNLLCVETSFKAEQLMKLK